jgi:hypothetical protein
VSIKITFLGTGTSQGVPIVACDCEVCSSLDPRDKRLRSSILIETEKRTDITEDTYKIICDYISNLNDDPADKQWLIDTTEKWCKDRAIYLALMESIKIADGQDEKKSRDSIPTILQEALAIGFDSHIGHDYLKDYEERYESYHRKEDKIPFDLEYFNKITKGGIPNKTLNIALAGCVHPGKSLRRIWHLLLCVDTYRPQHLCL